MKEYIHEYKYYKEQSQLYEYQEESGPKIVVNVDFLPNEKVFIYVDNHIFGFDCCHLFIYKKHTFFTYFIEFVSNIDKYFSDFYEWLKSNSDASDIEVIAYAIVIYYEIFRNYLDKEKQEIYSYAINDLNKRLPKKIKAQMLIYQV